MAKTSIPIASDARKYAARDAGNHDPGEQTASKKAPHPRLAKRYFAAAALYESVRGRIKGVPPASLRSSQSGVEVQGTADGAQSIVIKKSILGIFNHDK